jgi:hypothetical protein
MRASMASPAPLATDTMTITEATPMITPSMARKLLSAFTSEGGKTRGPAPKTPSTRSATSEP